MSEETAKSNMRYSDISQALGAKLAREWGFENVLDIDIALHISQRPTATVRFALTEKQSEQAASVLGDAYGD